MGYGDLYNNCDRGVNQNFIVRDNENIGTGEHILVDSYTTGISKCPYRDWETAI